LSHKQTDRTIIVNSGVYLSPDGEIVQFDRTRTGGFEDPIQFDRIDLVSYDRWKNELVVTSGIEAVTPSIPETPADMKPICAVRFRVSGNKILDTDDDDGIEHYIYKDLRKKFIPTLIKATNADIKAGVDDLKYVTCSGLQQAIQFFDLNFTIQGYRESLFTSRRVLWSLPYSDPTGVFKVYRKKESGGTYTEVASYTTGSGVNEYIDYEIYDGDVYFYVTYTSDSIYQETKEIIFKNSSISAIPNGIFGKAYQSNYYDSGDLERGYSYEYDNFYLDSTMNLTGTGQIAIFVKGDLHITNNGVINSAATEYKRQEVEVHGETFAGRPEYPYLAGGGAPGDPGAGYRSFGCTQTGTAYYGTPGTTGAEASLTNAGVGGLHGIYCDSAHTCNQPTQPAPGTNSGIHGGAGQNGGGNTQNIGGYLCTRSYGPGGGGAPVQGKSGMGNEGLIFVVKGDVLIDNGATFNGDGVNGTDGGNGGNGGDGATSVYSYGGDGGDGANGGNGGDALKVGIYHLGTGTATIASLNVSGVGGTAGTAGTGGTGGTAGAGGPAGDDGTDGVAGTAGADGEVTLTQLSS